MTCRSAWTRGLFYGGLFGGAIAAFPMIGAFVSKAPLSEIALGGGMIVLMWGTVGFLAGFASHPQPTVDADGSPLIARTPLFRRLLYRFVAGLLLSYIVGMVVMGLGFLTYAVWQGDFSIPSPVTWTVGKGWH